MPSLHADPHSTCSNPPPMRALVADDDPASGFFLCDGLRQLGVRAELCTDGLSALQRARAEAYDLLLLDCRMPGAGALQVLARLQAEPHASSAASLAVATSAEVTPQDRQRLLAAGFGEILLKPCGLADLQRLLALVQPDRHDAQVLDDEAGLVSTGDAAIMRSLRTLLRDELVALEPELDRLGRDRAAFVERLHRLRSSCGFCGAASLSAQAALLERLLAGHDATPAALQRFRMALQATLRALDRPGTNLDRP
ncbi:MAG: response regulator [Xanthomonadaceae bacterium]|nr:response regulator [Xanthomonadaceae bacterium]